MIRDDVEKAKKELVEFLELWTNGEDNMGEILAMLKEGGEAGLYGYRLFKSIHGTDDAMASWDMGAAVEGHFRSKFLKYSDEVEPAVT